MKIKTFFQDKIQAEYNNPFYNLVLYFVLNGLNQFIPFLLLPIILKYIQPQGYGIITSFNSLFDLLVILIGVGASISIQEKYFKIDFQKFQILFSNIFIYSTITLIPIVICIFLLKNTIDSIFNISIVSSIIAFAAATFHYFSTNFYQYLQLRKQILFYAVLIITETLLSFIISIILVKIGFDWKGRVMGIVLSYFVSMIITSTLSIKYGLLNLKNYDRSIINGIMKNGIQFVPNTIVQWIKRNADKLIILNFLDTSTLGYYAVGLTISKVVSLSIASINQGIKPFLYESLHINNFKKVYRFFLITSITGIIILFLLLLSRPLVFKYFVPESYHQLKNIFIWIIITSCIEGLDKFFINILIYFKKNMELSKIAFIINTMGIIISLFVVNKFGIKGVVINSLFITSMLFLSYLILTIKTIKNNR